MPDADAARLIDRIDRIRLFAHAYSWHLNFRLGTTRPVDLLHFAQEQGLAGVKIHVEDGEERSLLHHSSSRAEFAARAARLGLEVHVETSATDAATLAAAIAVAHDTGATSLRFYPRHAGRVSEVIARTIADLRLLPALDPEGRLDFLLEQHEDLTSHELVQILQAVPYDGGTTNRAGTRHGPREMRAMSMFIRPFHHVTRTSPYATHRVADYGDCPMNPLDIETSLSLIQTHYAGFRAAETRPLTAGGDHLISLPILRALAKDGPVGLVQFDAHSDTNDSYFGGQRFTHGTWLRRAIEEGLVDPARCVQIGIRGTRYAPDGNDFAENAGVTTLYIEDVYRLGIPGIIAETRRILGEAPAYLTFDVDSIDPAFAPGTGTPEVGGYTVFEAQQMLRGLKGLRLVGADVVEVAPPFDASGNTALVGATMMFEILCLLAT